MGRTLPQSLRKWVGEHGPATPHFRYLASRAGREGISADAGTQSVMLQQPEDPAGGRRLS